MLNRYLLMACALLPSLSAHAADDYPSKPIRIVVPLAAGGGTDTLARVIATKLRDRLGQPVVVENRSGAGGTIAGEAVASAAPDGYTLLGDTSGHTMPPFLSKSVRYRPIRDFTPIMSSVEIGRAHV